MIESLFICLGLALAYVCWRVLFKRRKLEFPRRSICPNCDHVMLRRNHGWFCPTCGHKRPKKTVRCKAKDHRKGATE